MILRKLLMDGLGCDAVVPRLVAFEMETGGGSGGGDMASEVDFFRRLKKDDGFLLSVAGSETGMLSACLVSLLSFCE